MQMYHTVIIIIAYWQVKQVERLPVVENMLPSQLLSVSA
jgi:hypothetical protein